MHKLRSPFVITGVVILTFFCLVAIFAKYLMPYPIDMLTIPLEKPSLQHLLGTNDIGQDILSELILGTRTALFIGVFSSLCTIIVGTTVGLVGGYFGGYIGKLLNECTALCMAIPQLPLAIVLVAFMRPSIWNIIIAICITSWTGTAKVIHAKTLELKSLPFIKIEEAFGQRKFIILFRHLLLNMLDIVLMRATLSISSAMLTEAGLSFIGLGVYNQKSWGTILYYAFHKNGVVAGFTWWYLPPIICISLCIFAFVLIGYYGFGSVGGKKQAFYEVHI